MMATGRFHAVMSETRIRIAPTRLASGYLQSSAVSHPCWVARYATIMSAVPTMPTKVNGSSAIAGVPCGPLGEARHRIDETFNRVREISVRGQAKAEIRTRHLLATRMPGESKYLV